MTQDPEPIRLLIVDDEEEFLATATRVLARRGFLVSAATRGAEALEWVRREPVDVILLDVKMPGMDGTEVFDRLHGERPDLPVIMLTGHGSPAHAFDMTREGVFDYLAKPCDLEILAERVRAAVDETRRRARTVEDPEGEGRAGTDDPSCKGPPVRVLLVDDEVELLDSLSKVLGRRGMEVHTARSGEEALDRLAGTLVDVVVLDIKMPGMDGLETLERIKELPADHEVILLTGHPTVENAMLGMKRGASDYVMKPPDAEILAGLIREARDRREARREAERLEKMSELLDRYPD